MGGSNGHGSRRLRDFLHEHPIKYNCSTEENDGNFVQVGATQNQQIETERHAAEEELPTLSCPQRAVELIRVFLLGRLLLVSSWASAGCGKRQGLANCLITRDMVSKERCDQIEVNCSGAPVSQDPFLEPQGLGAQTVFAVYTNVSLCLATYPRPFLTLF